MLWWFWRMFWSLIYCSYCSSQPQSVQKGSYSCGAKELLPPWLGSVLDGQTGKWALQRWGKLCSTECRWGRNCSCPPEWLWVPACVNCTQWCSLTANTQGFGIKSRAERAQQGCLPQHLSLLCTSSKIKILCVPLFLSLDRKEESLIRLYFLCVHFRLCSECPQELQEFADWMQQHQTQGGL